MPIYHFLCRKCGAENEITATITEKQEMTDPKFVCAQCGAKELEYILDFAGYSSGDKTGGCDSSNPPCASGQCPFA